MKLDATAKAASASTADSVAYVNITGKPTTVAAAGLTDVYTKTQSDAQIQSVLGGVSPTTLDTISELAAQMQADESGVASLVTTVAAKANTTDVTAALLLKSDTTHAHAVATSSVSGFLSASDKSKLDGIAAGATVAASRWQALPQAHE